MSMHLAHPSFTTIGKRKGKQKFRNADEARKMRELAAEWEQNQSKWKALSTPISKYSSTKPQLSPKIPDNRRAPNIPSIDTKVTGAVTVKQTMQYTGDNVLGVTIVHKSCLQPIFNKEAAVDAARMRRG